MQSSSFCRHDLWGCISLGLFNDHLIYLTDWAWIAACHVKSCGFLLSIEHLLLLKQAFLQLFCYYTCTVFSCLLLTLLYHRRHNSSMNSLKEHVSLANVALIWDVKMQVRKAHLIFRNWKYNVNGSLPWISETVSTHQLETGLQFVMMVVIGNVSNGYWNTEVSLESDILNTERYCINYTHQFCIEYFVYSSFEF